MYKEKSCHDPDSTLYPVTTSDVSLDGRVKVHYVGCSSKYNGWREKDDLVQFETQSVYTVDGYDHYLLLL